MTTADTAHSRIRIDSLTSLRFFAAALVLVHHLFYKLAPASPMNFGAAFGYVGVAFFFVLSGFVLSWTYQPTLPRRFFYGRRVARVYPMHLLTAAIATVLVLSWGGSLQLLPSLANLLLLQAWIPQEQFASSLNPVSWSLSCEAFFYLVFPLLIRVGLRARLLSIAIAVVTAMVVVTAVVVVLAPAGAAQQVLYHAPWFRVGEFTLGVLLAQAVQRGLRSPVGLPAAIGIWIGSFFVARMISVGLVRVGDLPDLRVYADLLVLAPTCLLVVAAASNDVEGRQSWLHQPWLLRLGEASFALYLVHYLLIQEWRWAFGDPQGLAATVVAIAVVGSAAVGLSLLLYRLVERPAEARLRRVIGQPRPTSLVRTTGL